MSTVLSGNEVEQRRERLTRLYNDTSSTHVTIRDEAQARLEMQLQLRSWRGEKNELIHIRDEYKETGDLIGFEKARYELEQLYPRIGATENKIQRGIDNKTIRKWSRKWRIHRPNLDELLQHEELDIRTDFTGLKSANSTTEEWTFLQSPTNKETLRIRVENNAATRKTKLTMWYNDTFSADLATREQAQARLQLQLQLRATRINKEHYTRERNECRAKGDLVGLDAAKKKLKTMYIGTGDISRIVRDPAGPSRKIIKKYSKIWKSNPLSLEVLLQHQELDVAVDFADAASSDALDRLWNTKVDNQNPLAEANGDEKNVSNGKNQLNTTLEYEDQEQSTTFLETDSVKNSSERHGKNVELGGNHQRDVVLQDGKQDQIIRSDSLNEHQTLTSKLKNEYEDEKLTFIEQKETEIWERHAELTKLTMMAMDTPDHIITIKLAIHRKTFQYQLAHEAQVEKTHGELSDKLSENPSVPPSLSYQLSSFWELSSTKLWTFFEDGTSWDLPNWTPGGHLEIRPMDGGIGMSTLTLDFGHRSFYASSVRIPETAGTQYRSYTAVCDQAYQAISFEIAFLGSGCLIMRFPALALIQPDSGCKILPIIEEVVEFSGTVVALLE
jgi:hypothetical protein